MIYSKYYAMLADDCINIDFTEADYAFFNKHNLAMYFYIKDDAVKQHDLMAYKTNYLMAKLRYKNILEELCEITKALELESIDYLILKGVGISEIYPEPCTRVMGDHDILVKPKDFKLAIEVLKSLDYVPDEDSVTFKDVSLYKEGAIMIELHHALLRSEKDSFALHFTDELWQATVKYDLGVGSIDVPNPEIHFRYLTLHMMKHLKGMGFGLRHLLDFKYFALAHGINLERQLPFFESIGYGAFYRAIVTICHYELKMTTESEGWLFPRASKVVQILADYIAEIGVFGRESEITNINRHFEHFQTSINSNSKLVLFMVSLFPRRSLLTEHYLYAIKNKWLLPVAWGHRFISMVFNKEIRIKEKLFFFTKDERSMAEVAYMMHSLGLRDEL